ncbi:thiamine kinase [Dickeya dianthicola]|uniref:Thiamine kinase n=1 Tax=Dickeya dianthicola TaxID=204039 RepID=A0ABX9NMQ5_9GAMM|nr:phosphotransferase [Dickeya dianthicola]MCI4067551.1 phosphotransferase [Dickeya dianthicola]MCI4114279.1 phosphotransferase [Dickeya dianthicola]MCI4120390.1 phosphotransferase [Dickeya dianthicola]MCI4124158.1 phosphotransferase [Dickeya dianthicola]MCI4192293.1 phosphotransferase [Dickeya dianthicola]
MVRFASSEALNALLQQVLPAVATAGFYLQPVNGLSHQSWRVHSPVGLWLARGETPQGRQLGTSRQREFHVLRQLAGQSLAPHPVCWRDGWLLVEWLTGEPADARQFAQSLAEGQLAATLARLHHQPRYGYPLALKRLMAQHWQHMDPARRSPRLRRAYQQVVDKPLPTPLLIAPLHLDVHPGNLLRTEAGWRLIDWEYAADGDIGLELALLFRACELDDAHQQDFLQAYCQHWRGLRLASLRRQAARWQYWVDYLVPMWFEVRWRQTGEATYRQTADAWRRSVGWRG